MELDIPGLFEKHYREIASYLLRRRVDRPTAEDLASETFLQAWTCRATYDPARGGQQAWLFGIALNLLRHQFRSERRGLEAYARAASQEIDASDGPDETCARLDARASVGRIAGALATLSQGDLDVITLVCWTDLSQEQIAIVLNIPNGTVKSRLHRARRQLRERLGDSDSMEGNDE